MATREDPPGANDQSFEKDLNRLARAIQAFRVDAQRFLAGDLLVPPEERRLEIASTLRRLRGANLKGVAETYRLNSLEAQYNSYNELFGRRLRESEVGGSRHQRSSQPKHDPGKGIIVGTTVEPEAVNALYQGLYLSQGKRNPKVDLERFRSMVHQQAQTIRQKTGCREISFRVALEGGKLKLKAKPIRGA